MSGKFSGPASPLTVVSRRPTRRFAVCVFASLVVDQHRHALQLGKRLSRDIAVDKNVAAENLDRFAGQPHEAFDAQLAPIVRMLENDRLPTPRAAQLKRCAIDKQSVSRQIGAGWQSGSVKSAVGANRSAGGR